MSQSSHDPGNGTVNRRWAWIAVAFGTWIAGGTLLVARGLDRGEISDAGLSPYHAVLYGGMIALAAVSCGLALRARRREGSWRRALLNAFPPGMGSLGAGSIALLAAVIADVAWREGVGIDNGSIEGWIAPSRILLLVGLALIAMAPMRAALLVGSADGARWPVAMSAGLLGAVLTTAGSFSPFVSPWLEQAPDVIDDNAEIWVMDADGTRQTRLVEAIAGTQLQTPAWAPDGSRISYARYTGPADDPTRGDYDIWVMNGDGSDNHAVVAGPAWQWFPRWSPDGAWLAFTQESVGGPWLESGPQGPATGPGPQGPVFPARNATRMPEADIWRVPIDGSGEPVQITLSESDDRAASWSPDGRRLAFDSTRDGNTEIYVIDADGTNPTRLTNSPGQDWAAAWSPDGSEIAFSSDRSGTHQVWIMNADGSAPRRLTDGPGEAQWPAWSPDGSRIVFSSWQQGDWQAWSIRTDGTDRTELTRSPGAQDHIWDGSWAPAERIVFTRSAMGPAELQPIVRQNLGVAAMLVTAFVLALVAGLLGLTRPVFGAMGLMLGITAALAALVSDAWQFVGLAVGAGLIVDVALWLVPRHRPSVAAAGAALAVLLAAALGGAAMTGIGWSPTLLAGVACAVTLGGWTIGGLLERHEFRPAPVVSRAPAPADG